MKTKHIFSILVFCTISIFTASAQQWGDYTLYSGMNSTTTTLLDTLSATYHTWNHGTKQTGYSTYLLPGGILVRTVKATGVSFTGGPICGEIQKVDYAGNVTWDYVYSTTNYCTHHDILPMPNGNVMVIAYERKTGAEVTAAGCTSFTQESWPEKIVEIMPTGATTGTVVWEWHAWDHLMQNTSASLANYQSSIVNHPELINVNLMTQKDWMHMNGLDYNPILDQVTFTCHNLSEQYIIDHSTTTAEAAGHTGGNSGKGGDILYRWGKPGNYGASGAQILNVCHDAHWIPEGVPNAGNLVAFNNNGVPASMTASYVDSYTPPVNGYNYSLTLGSAYTPATYSSRITTTGHTSNMGNSQQLPNGNKLICVALTGLIYEVNPANTTIWSYTASGSIPQAFRYDACYLNNPAPAIPTVTENAGTLSSTSATTYQWYMNGQLIAGATSQTYTPTSDGIYLVRITDANGCVYEYSTGYHFTMSSIGITENTLSNNISIYPNPLTGIVNFDNTYLSGKNYEVSVYDIVGKLILKEKNTNKINLSQQMNGVYFITIAVEKGETITKKISLLK